MNVLGVGTPAFLMLALTGCLQPAREIFPEVIPPLVWPLPPDQPRVRYVGELRSSADLHPARSGWQRLRETLDPGEYRPIPLTTPHALAVGEDDRIYVVDTGSASLHVIDLVRRTHRRVEQAGSQRLRSPVGVAIAGNRLFVSDAIRGRVSEFDLEGNYRRELPVQLQRPGGIAYDPEHRRLYVVDTVGQHCVCLDESGVLLFGFGERGSQEGQFNFPTHIAYSPLLGLLISDTLNACVRRFDPDGTYVGSIGQKGDGAGDLSLPKGVAVDSDGNVYIVDAHFENVQVFRADGRLLLAFGEEGNAQGQFSLPCGLAIDRHNRIWVADSYNHRLEVFQYPGGGQP